MVVTDLVAVIYMLLTWPLHDGRKGYMVNTMIVIQNLERSSTCFLHAFYMAHTRLQEWLHGVYKVATWSLQMHRKPPRYMLFTDLVAGSYMVPTWSLRDGHIGYMVSTMWLHCM
jgi:hypothetical protein